MNGRPKNAWRWARWLEFTLLFGGVPAGQLLMAPHAFMLPVLWAVAAVCWLMLRRDSRFDRASLWRLAGWRAVWWRCALRFVGCAAALGAVVLLCDPDRFLDLPRERPRLWITILLLYPPLSVIPQGIVYRSFLFHRYRELAPPRIMAGLAALAFSLGHLPFGNPWALGLTLAGGWFFNDTYRRTCSALPALIEHALYGALIFTVGFGSRFLYASLRLAEAFR